MVGELEQARKPASLIVRVIWVQITATFVHISLLKQNGKGVRVRAGRRSKGNLDELRSKTKEPDFMRNQNQEVELSK